MNVRTKHWTLKPHRNMRQHKVFLRHELLKYNSEKSTAKSSALENYISSANLSLSGCSSAEPNSVSVGRCKFQLKKLYLQIVKKVDHLPKSDRVDAHQIAQYGFRNLDKIMLCTEPELIHQQLKILNTEREKMLSAISSFSRTGEAEEFLGKEVFKVVKTHNRQTLSALRKQLKQLDDKISALLRSNEDLKKKQELLKTIPGIAEVGSLYLLLATKGFTRFKNWRKFACYCGIAPFEYSSGSSIRGRNRVNPLADKKMKSLLHLLALTSIRHDPELKLYYERKKEEGKHSLLVLNNVKCKLVSRIFAVIKRETPYVKTHQFAN